jgi:EmrB/QacA subfamily drug resistance transporter
MSTLSPTQSGTTERRRWIALIVVCLAMLMNALDGSIVNVALPSIQRELHFAPSSLTWVVDAYLIAFGSFLMLAGRLGDLLGRKKIFLGGVALFTLASGACALATSQGWLIAARFVQGVGGAVSTSVIVAIIVTEFAGAAERAKAMSAYMFVAVGGGSLGLLVGGILTQSVSWHWIFLINVPIGITTLVLGSFLIRENEGLGVRHGLDVTGSLLLTGSLLIGIFGIVKASSYGWLSSHTFVSLGLSLALFGAFVSLEARVARPIVPLRIFRLRSLSASSVVRGLTFAAMYAVFFFGALYLERILHFGPLATGLAFLPMSLVMAAMSLGATSKLLMRFGPMRLLVPGLSAVVTGLVLLTRTGVHSSYLLSVLPAFVLLGVGMSISAVPLLTIAMADVPREDAGLASGIVNVSMWLASSTALAVMGTLAASTTSSHLARGSGSAAAAIAGYHVPFLIGAVLAASGLVVTVTLLRSPAQRESLATYASTRILDEVLEDVRVLDEF